MIASGVPVYVCVRMQERPRTDEWRVRGRPDHLNHGNRNDGTALLLSNPFPVSPPRARRQRSYTHAHFIDTLIHTHTCKHTIAYPRPLTLKKNPFVSDRRRRRARFFFNNSISDHSTEAVALNKRLFRRVIIILYYYNIIYDVYTYMMY